MPVIPLKSDAIYMRFIEFSKGRLFQDTLAQLMDEHENKIKLINESDEIRHGYKESSQKSQIIYTQPTESDEVKALKQQLLEADKRIQLLNKKIKKLSEE